MKELFQEADIGGMTLRNRFVRSATWEGMCEEDGRPTLKLAELYRELSKGRIGLLISGYTYVSPEGKQMPGKMGIYTDEFAGEMKELAAAVHEEGGRICMQLVHAGGQASPRLTGGGLLAPSAVEAPLYPEVPAAMSTNEIEASLDAFASGAARAREYGFDAVQLHGAHGYLINQFLSPLTNRREDGYGGTREHRTRYLLESFRAVRKAVGKGFPVLIKLNGSDFIEGGLEVEDALFAARSLDDEGIDAIEVSGGTSASGALTPVRTKIDSPDKEAYNLTLAAGIKKAVGCPVISVGGFRSLEVIREAFEGGETDFFSLSRPLIREPHLVARWEAGDGEKARCISCNACFRPGLKEGGIYCVQERKEAARRRSPD